MLDDALLADWGLRYLGAPFERVLFRSGYLSDVVVVELSSGFRAVVKARPFQPRIAGCLQVQAALALSVEDTNDERTMRTPVLAESWSLERERNMLTSTQYPVARHVEIRVVNEAPIWNVRRIDHAPSLFGIELSHHSDALHRHNSAIWGL